MCIFLTIYCVGGVLWTSHSWKPSCLYRGTPSHHHHDQLASADGNEANNSIRPYILSMIQPSLLTTMVPHWVISTSVPQRRGIPTQRATSDHHHPPPSSTTGGTEVPGATASFSLNICANFPGFRTFFCSTSQRAAEHSGAQGISLGIQLRSSLKQLNYQ